jgi:GT2 family glycosyltransferase
MLENISSNQKVAIIILNWNGWKDTIECLESLSQITYQNYDIIVVDNGSIDESIKKIREYCEGKINVESQFFKYDDNNKPMKMIEYTREESATGGKESKLDNIDSNKKLILIKNEKNYGFAEGNNIALRYVLKNLNSEYILLLNNDTVVDINFLDELVKAAERDDKIGAVGPKIYYYYKKNLINFVGGNISLWRSEVKIIGKNMVDAGQFNKIRDVSFIEGSCILIKNEVINRVGYLDTDYFCYYEDTDWCIRIKKSGYKLLCIPKARIWHKIATSTSLLSPLRAYYWGRNSFLLLKKNASLSQYFFYLIYFFTFRFWIICGIILFHKKLDSFFSFIKGIKDIKIFNSRSEYHHY